VGQAIAVASITQNVDTAGVSTFCIRPPGEKRLGK